MRLHILPLLIVALFCLPSGRAVAQDAIAGVDEQDWAEQVEVTLAAGTSDEDLDRLSVIIKRYPDSLEARFKRAALYSARAQRTFFERPNASILDPNDLREISQAASRLVRGEDVTIDFGADHDISRAVLDFEHVLLQDSSFDNALYEYSKLMHSHYVFDRAISLGEAQVRIHPDEPSGHEELIASYRHFLEWTDPSAALTKLGEIRTSYSLYFQGEIHRREGRLYQAESAYNSLLASHPRVPREPVLLSLARVRIEQERYRAAYEYIEQALRFETLVGARLLFNQFWYVLDPQELASANTLESAEEYADFFDRVWSRRSPTPAGSVNWRLVEHFRRLIVAEREHAFFGSRKRPMDEVVGPSAVVPAFDMDVDVPTWYYDVHGFSDKGLIYIRYGEPDRKVWTQPLPADPPHPGVPPNESWRYVAEGLDFHFVNPLSGGQGYAWYLVASLGGCYMASDRSEWGGAYMQLAPRMRGSDLRNDPGPTHPCDGDTDPREVHDVVGAFSRLSEAGRESIDTGLTTDRHTWSTTDVESFNFPFTLATFRGEGGRTDVSVYYALPVGQFSESSLSGEIPVEVGMALHDTSWQSVADDRATWQYPRTDDVTKAAFGEIHLSVPPDSYRVSVHADVLASPLLGGYQLMRAVPDYTRTETMMSDVLLAYDIRPKTGHMPSARSSLDITANPFLRSAIDQPLFVYFELYHLALDEGDISRYRVRYTLEPTEKEGGVLGLFGRTPPGLSVSATFEDTTPSPIVFSELDVTELPQGEYKLGVDVTDENSSLVLSREVTVELFEQ